MAIINGDSLPNTLFGTPSSDTIHGGAGDDTLYGLEGDDQLFGDDGANTFIGGPGADAMDGGGGGDDTVNYGEENGPSGVIVNLHAVDTQGGVGPDSARDSFGFIDRTVSIRHVVGTEHADIIFGGDRGNTVTGGAGDDYYNGRAGEDTSRYSGNYADYHIAKLANGTVYVTDLRSQGGDGRDTLVNVETLRFTDQAVAIATLPAATAFIAPVVADPTPSDGFNESRSSASVTLFLTGVLPTPDKLIALNAFANLQLEAYTAAGVMNPLIGPYEALGRGFAETSEFAAKYGAATEAAFVASTYVSVFGRDPSTVQKAHFQAQIEYFEMIYESVGIPSAQADLLAKGAVLGQMIGYAALDLV
jgi:Ca2+-binding RTX toxin-like protein